MVPKPGDRSSIPRTHTTQKRSDFTGSPLTSARRLLHLPVYIRNDEAAKNKLKRNTPGSECSTFLLPSGETPELSSLRNRIPVRVFAALEGKLNAFVVEKVAWSVKLLISSKHVLSLVKRSKKVHARGWWFC